MRTPPGNSVVRQWMRHAPPVGIAVACGLAVVATAVAQGPATVTFTVRETAGIRRTEYPVSTTVSWSRGVVSDASRLRLGSAGVDVVAQFTPVSRWDDGSIRQVEVDFNASIGASERRSLSVEVAGAGAPAGPAPPRSALSVAEDADHVTVGSVRLGRRAWPLLASVAYRGEIVGGGPNGISLTDDSGAAQAFGASGDVVAEVVKRGPLLAVVRYSGRVVLGGGAIVPVVVTCELPNSKSWIKMTLRLDDPARRIRRIRFDTPLALGPFPWLWDLGTDSGSYGVLRSPVDRVVLTQRVGTAAQTQWRIENGTGTDLRVYEQSTAGRATTVAGWGHLLDSRNAVAFAVVRFASQPATQIFTLTGEGGLAYDLVPSRPAARHEVVYYQHYVGTPVAVGAATSPAAMLSPLVVSLDR